MPPQRPQFDATGVRSSQHTRRERRKRVLARLSALALAVALIAVAVVAVALRSPQGTVDRAGRASTRTVVRSDGATPSAILSPDSARVANRQLGVALAPLLKQRTGRLAVGVVDLTTGAHAAYHGGRHFHTASIVKVDILAALLLQHQATATPLSAEERELAAQMIEYSNNDAATMLWDAVGRAPAVARANVRLGLHQTRLGKGGYWGLTSTTVGDQLRLLSDLVSDSSPLTAASRAYELLLMRHVESEEAWGVTAAATPGTSPALKTGLLPDPQLLVVNSIGVIHHGGHLLLEAILSHGQPTQAIGVAQENALAVAAADEIVVAGK